MKKFAQYIRILLMAVLTVALVFALNRFTVKPAKPVQQTTQKQTETQTQKYTVSGTAHEDFDLLLQKYKDTVGYINIPGTKIDDVVVQGRNNDYYLRRSPAGGYSFAGCYFVDYRCNMDTLSQNTTIYGHNLRDSSRLFGQLTKYKKLDFYKSSPTIKFDTLDKNAEWKVFAVFITNVKGVDGVIFNYREPNYSTQDEFLKFIERAKRRSVINCPVDVKANDKILTLSTCDYQIDNDWRLAIMGRLVRDGENPAVDVSKAETNPNPLYPEGWYKRKGGKRPVYNDEPTLK